MHAPALLLTTGLVVLSAGGAASSAGCLDEVGRLASRYALDAGTGGGRPAARGGSGGSGASTGEPAAHGRLGWGASDAPAATGSEADPHHLSVAARGEAEALLRAARSADAEGRPGDCLRRLREAEAVITGEGG